MNLIVGRYLNMKSYTDIEQSRKLAEILPLETADMDYIPICNLEGEYSINVNIWNNDHLIDEGWIPCWSLAALLNVLPDDCGTEKEDGKYVASYIISNECGAYTKDNPIDACVEMIIGLKEQNLL